MSMREQEYVRSTWELAVREGLLPRTPMIEIINALCTNIRKLIDEIRDRGGMIKSDVVWVIIGAVWVDIVGNRQLFEARPSPLQCIRMEEFIHIDTLERIAGGLYMSADGVVEALLNASPGRPNAPSFSSVASSSAQAGGDTKDTAPKPLTLIERVAAARRKNESIPAPIARRLDPCAIGDEANKKVVIKPHRFEDKNMSDEILHLNAEFKVWMAYNMFTKWVADMCSTGEAQDLAEFVQEEIQKLCTAGSKQNAVNVDIINRAFRSDITIKPPGTSPRNSYFFSMKSGSPDEKRIKEEEE
ncbi:hypothetical protein PG987_007902 [Apiospora arundinis]